MLKNNVNIITVDMLSKQMLSKNNEYPISDFRVRNFDTKIRAGNVKEFLTKNSPLVIFLFGITKVLKAKTPRFIHKLTFLLLTKNIRKSPSGYLILGYAFFMYYESIFNPYLIKFLRNYTGKVIVYLYDSLESIKTFHSNEFVEKLFEYQVQNVFDLQTYCYTDAIHHNIPYIPYYISENIFNSIPHFAQTDNPEFEITTFLSLFGTSRTKKEILKRDYVLNLIKVCQENDIKLGYNLTFFSQPTAEKDTEQVSFLKEKQNLPDLRGKEANGNLKNRVYNTQIMAHISDENYLSNSHWEALYFNKRLLTNSECVKLEPWYDPKFVRVVDYMNLTDDDIAWIKTDVDVNYQHKEVLSAEHFFKHILEL